MPRFTIGMLVQHTAAADIREDGCFNRLRRVSYDSETLIAAIAIAKCKPDDDLSSLTRRHASGKLLSFGPMMAVASYADVLIIAAKQWTIASTFLQFATAWQSRLSSSDLIGGCRAAQPEALQLTYRARLPFPLPPLPEQRAIAEALSDVDGLLGGLDRLIAKKRDLKQAAMQQLLTGQTRLPGFHGEWEVKRLGELANSCSGGSHTGDS